MPHKRTFKSDNYLCRDVWKTNFSISYDTVGRHGLGTPVKMIQNPGEPNSEVGTHELKVTVLDNKI